MFKTLIIEDNLFLSEALRAALQAHFPFLALLQATGIREALAQVESAPPGLIFTDMRLPDGNGLEFTRSLRAAGIDSAIVFLTSQADIPEYREAALSSGADLFLSKGTASLSDIFGAVESILASRARVLIAAEDADYREQMDVFFSRGWPSTVVACTGDWDDARKTADILKPDLVVVRSAANTEWDRRFRETIGGVRAGGRAYVIGICDPGFADACPADHRVENGAEFSQAMVAIINLTLADRAYRL